MRIRQAFLDAADWIEKNPHLYDFNKDYAPDDCGTPACMWGWVGYFLGMQGEHNHDIAWATGANETDRLYRYNVVVASRAASDANDAASLLRQYADHYHPDNDGHKAASWADCAWSPATEQRA